MSSKYSKQNKVTKSPMRSASNTRPPQSRQLLNKSRSTASTRLNKTLNSSSLVHIEKSLNELESELSNYKDPVDKIDKIILNKKTSTRNLSAKPISKQNRDTSPIPRNTQSRYN
jgi:hypothetical protein